MSFVSCHDEPVPPDPDAGQIQFERDAGLDGHVGDTGEVPGDGDLDDALADARLDGAPDARPDARPDAYVPPDTPVG